MIYDYETKLNRVCDSPLSVEKNKFQSYFKLFMKTQRIKTQDYLKGHILR